MTFIEATNLILIGVALVNVLFSVVILSHRGSRTKVQYLFALIAVGVALWTLIIVGYRHVNSYEQAMFALRKLYLIPLIIPITYVYFSTVYTQSASKYRSDSYVTFAGLCAAVLLAALVFFTDTIVVDVIVVPLAEKAIVFGPLYWLYVLYFISVFSWGFWVLFRSYLNTRSMLKQQQLLFLLIGTVSASSIAMITNLVLPWMGYYQVNWFGNITTLFFVGFIFYAVVRHKLFDVRLITFEVLTFLLWTLLFFRVFSSTGLREQFENLVIFLISIVVGVMIIRSGVREINNREKGERLARYLANANARLRELDKQKTEFVSIASHQLRAPIAAIKGYTSMVIDGTYGPVPKKLDEPLSRVMESGKRIAIMVDDFLNVTRMEQGRMNYAMQQVNIVPLLHSVVEELTLVAGSKGVVLSFDSAEETLVVVGDEGKLRQVFANIIENATKYTPEGTIHVLAEPVSERRAVVVRVTDTGIGIAQEEIPKLFNKFSRASNADTATVYGTGLGLYVAREIVRAHNGWIHVTSPGIGKGTVFTIELPLTQGDAT